MILSSKASIVNFTSKDDTVSAIIQTSNQSIKKQPLVWLIHGSGGVSSSELLWQKYAHKHNCTTVIIDSYSSRGVYKQNWDGKDKRYIGSYTRAHDIINCYKKIQEVESEMLKFIDSSINIMIGFSYGATSVIRLATDRFTNRTAFVSWPVYACYPAFQNANEELYNVDKGKVHIFHGEKDNWCLATNSLEFAKRTNNTIDMYRDVHHSFSKPGVNETHWGIPNGYGDDGVFAKYDDKATKKSIRKVFSHVNSLRA
jgi:dienelactone hydrolase